jgi:hypothetical protein
MKKSVVVNLGSFLLFLLILSMGIVFFTCGDDDDDDWDEDDDDSTDDDASGCSSIVAKIAQCQESYDWIQSMYWFMEVGTANERCFLSWCDGAGYDTVGFFSYYDFNADCFNGDCNDLIDNFDVYSEMYDECNTMNQLMYYLDGIQHMAAFDGSCLYDSGK